MKISPNDFEYWERDELTKDWKIALRLFPVHKKWDKKDVNNYRGISLLLVTYKILSKPFLNRLEKQMATHTSEY